MSSEKFIEVLEPKIGQGFATQNVKDANLAAGFPETHCISVDAPTKSEWVNPLPFIVVIADALKRQQETNVRQEQTINALIARLNEVESTLKTEVGEFDKFADMFKCVTIEPSVDEVKTE